MFDRLDKNMDELMKAEMKNLKSQLVYTGKEARKARLLEHIELTQSSLLDRIKSVTKEVVLGSMSKFMIKENLNIRLGFLEGSPGISFYEQIKLWFKRSMAVSVVAFVLLFIAFQPWTNNFTASADARTYLASFVGNVKVLRAGQELLLAEGLELKDNDQVIVGLDSSAEVRLFSNNVVRLKENSHLVLSQVFIKDNSRMISLNLVEGELWASVFESLGKFSQFKLKSGDMSVYTSEPVRFTVRKNQEYTHVVAIDNSLDVVMEHNRQLITQALQSEQILRVRAPRPYISYQQRLSLLDTAADLDLDWYEKNLVADRLFKEELKNNANNLIATNLKVKPDSSLYGLKELSRKADVALTLDPAKKQKKKLENAKEKFFEAQYLLQKQPNISVGDSNEKAETLATAKKLLAEYQDEVEEVTEVLPRLAYSDPKAAEDVQRQLDADLSEQKTTLNVLKDDKELLLARVVQVETEKVASTTLKTEPTKTEALMVADMPAMESMIQPILEVAELEPVVQSLQPATVEIVADNEDELIDADEDSESEDANMLIESVDIEAAIDPVVQELEIVVEEVVELKEVKLKTGEGYSEPVQIEGSSGDDLQIIEGETLDLN